MICTIHRSAAGVGGDVDPAMTASKAGAHRALPAGLGAASGGPYAEPVLAASWIGWVQPLPDALGTDDLRIRRAWPSAGTVCG
ncbi:hypothetical protein ACIBCD_16775 [Nocardia brasiliensis]|uniref:hypothetical protein n=1 Tax=Nocardia brasiliensis TaxID=37326 RepID=UPI0024557FDF|nr:hypothetical protein [Nocardia brasiliensis]